MLAFIPLARAVSSELIMFEAQGCEYCERWNSEVGDIYADTDVGRSFPLRRVDMDDEWPRYLRHIKGIRYSPTFVVVDGGREVGRMTGYIDEAFFWGYLDEITKGLVQGNQGKDTPTN